MNVVIEGIDGVGKTTLANKLIAKYNMQGAVHSTAKTRNDFTYHMDLLDYRENTVFDRFHFGEFNVFPKIYGRPCMLNKEEWTKLNQKIISNNDLFIVMLCSDLSLIDTRLKERGELSYIEEIRKQEPLFREAAEEFKNTYNYKNFYIFDLAEPNAYDKLDEWIELHMNKVNTNTAYRNICRDLFDKGHVMETKNIRGGTKELCNYLFTVDDLDTEYVSLETGKSDLTYLAAELLWYWSSRNDTEFIGKFAKLWTMLSDDGVTNNSAYGYILQQKHGFNQIEKIIELLKYDPYSRRAVLNINVPNEHVIETKDEPCTIALTYQIRGGKLHCTAVMRSNDVRFGLRNDFGYFIYLLKYIAYRLGIEAGSYTHFAESIHFYDKDEPFVKAVAYGTMDEHAEKLNITKLIDNSAELIDWVDNKFTSKEDFTQILRDREIIYKTF